MMNTIYKNAALLVAILFWGTMLTAQDFEPWPVPEDAAAVVNPIESNKQSLEEGKALFNLQCIACHGETAKGDGLIKSANLTTEAYKLQSDGAAFWKLQQGRSQMPSFKALPKEQLWSIINYIKSLGAVRDPATLKDAVVSISFDMNGDKKELSAKVLEVLKDGNKIPASGIKVNFGIKRYFGMLAINSKTTDSNGELTIAFPEEIIGDETGKLSVTASIEDLDYKPAEVSENVDWGLLNPKNYWTERRALWKNNDYIPIWLFAGFILVTLGIWGTIIYVSLLVRKIKVEGDKYKKNLS